MRRFLAILALGAALVLGTSCADSPAAEDFSYVVQVFTGGWNNVNYDTADIIARLDSVSATLPVGKVIIGWNLDPTPYKEIGEFLHSRDIKMLLWLPVFSEIGGLYDCDLSLDLWGQAPASYALQEGEDFTFFCPSSERNLDNFLKIYEEHFADCGFDGVFIDKIRSQSFISGAEGILSCGCDNCRDRFLELGVDIDEVAEEWKTKGDAMFSVTSYTPETGFVFENGLTDRFLKAKAAIISDSVGKICDYFHDKGMLVGMDLYAPLMAQFVGQDYAALGAKADFIKPMLYRRTEAPAGIGFEYGLLRESLPGAAGYPDFVFDKEFLEGQLEAVAVAPCAKFPGIEINYREEFARTDEEYVSESVGAVIDAGFEGAVLSWDVMLAPNAHINCLVR